MDDILVGMDGVLIMATGIGVFVALVMQLIKTTYLAATNKELNKNWIPLIAVVVGMVMGLAVAPFTSMDWVLRLWAGAVSGFMASGIYETVKKTTNI